MDPPVFCSCNFTNKEQQHIFSSIKTDYFCFDNLNLFITMFPKGNLVSEFEFFTPKNVANHYPEHLLQHKITIPKKKVK